MEIQSEVVVHSYYGTMSGKFFQHYCTREKSNMFTFCFVLLGLRLEDFIIFHFLPKCRPIHDRTTLRQEMTVTPSVSVFHKSRDRAQYLRRGRLQPLSTNDLNAMGPARRYPKPRAKLTP